MGSPKIFWNVRDGVTNTVPHGKFSGGCVAWHGVAEGAIFTEEVNSFVEQVRALGPLNWPTSGGGIEQMFAVPEHMLATEVTI